MISKLSISQSSLHKSCVVSTIRLQNSTNYTPDFQQSQIDVSEIKPGHLRHIKITI